MAGFSLAPVILQFSDPAVEASGALGAGVAWAYLLAPDRTRTRA